MQIRIYYEDTDTGGVVYHSNYFKYCERARSEALWQNGFDVCDSRCGFVVKKIINANFIEPAILGDLIQISTKITSHKKASFVTHHEILRDNKKIFETDILVAYLCDKKPSRIPQKLLEFLVNY